MSCFLRKTVLFGFSSVRILPPTGHLLASVGSPDVFCLRWFSSVSNQPSFTISYLMRELGFSQKSALKVSKLVNFDTSEKPDEVIKMFKKYGFTQTEISAIFRSKPHLLVADAEKVISPKLEFFDAKGISWPQFTKRLSSFPTVLGSSLDQQIMLSFEFLKSFLHSDEKAIAVIQKYPNILTVNVEKCLAPNINFLREHGVPNCNIAKLILSQPQGFTSSLDRFRGVVEEVAEMGFNPKRAKFVYAVLVLVGLSKAKWESKFNAFKKRGWSEEEVLKVFEGNPWCMMISEDKILAGMDFFMNNMGLRPCVIAKTPVILSLSLKKRIIPRFSVFQALLSKGLVEEEVSLRELFMEAEYKFLWKFVAAHEKEAPELLKLYKEKLNLSHEPQIDDQER